MAFGFFKDKSSGPREVSCPLCQHSQQESPLAVSSYCKNCGAYLSFGKDGEVAGRAQATPDPFAHRPPQPKVEIEYKAREEKKVRAKARPTVSSPEPAALPEPTREALQPEKADPIEVEEPPNPPLPEATIEITPEETPQPEDSPEENAPRYHGSSQDHDAPPKKLGENERVAICFECGDSHVANALANSTQCRKCGRLISLEDQHIRQAWSSKIQTRGNVFIHKKGVVLGASIQCHNLTVEGDFTGSAECSGDLTLQRHGKIIGKVVCDRLLVQKRAKVEFLNTVEMNECQIDGLVTGNLACRGRLALEKKATLTGNIKVGTLTVADGAKHTGKIQMGAF